eukprot:c13559_g1_i1.p1 GENE.c13559_g1_i1~~c13559_g1_i1.p1  ORF type:complete len:132 (+),score=45.70 c13559_g1_i1:34-429(+)
MKVIFVVLALIFAVSAVPVAQSGAEHVPDLNGIFDTDLVANTFFDVVSALGTKKVTDEEKAAYKSNVVNIFNQLFPDKGNKEEQLHKVFNHFIQAVSSSLVKPQHNNEVEIIESLKHILDSATNHLTKATH